MIINLQVLLSIDRFWAICRPISYFQQVTTRRRTLATIICLGICAVADMFSGLFICAIQPSYNNKDKISITSCNEFESHKAVLKGFFFFYVTTAIVTIVGLSAFTVLRIFKRVSWSSVVVMFSPIIFLPIRVKTFSEVMSRRRNSSTRRLK